MRLLVDGYWWIDGPPSGRNVLRSLVTHWLREFPDDELTLRVPKRHLSDAMREISHAALDISVDQYPRWAVYHAAAVASLNAKRCDFDMVLSQNFCPLYTRVPSAVLVHDAIFVTNPEWFTTSELLYLRTMRPTLRRAAVILATSHSEADRIATVWPELENRVKEIGLAVPVGLENCQPMRPKGWCGGAKFILAVGRLNVRKNLDRLVDAYIQATGLDSTLHLVIAGEKDGSYESTTVIDSAMSRVHFLGSVSDGELRWLYKNCELFVFPSLDEGFGLPLIEAHSTGSPVIASDIPVFRELDVAIDYFDPTSVASMSACIQRALDAEVREGATAQIPTWKDVASKIRCAVEAEVKG